MEMLISKTNLSEILDLDALQIITSPADILYLQNLSEYLQEVPAHHLEFFLWLSVVEELILHTTSDMRLLHQEYMRLIVGTEGSSSRSLYCVHAVNSLMGMAVSYALSNDEFTNNILPRVHRMLNDIHKSFNHLVTNTEWMDAETKNKTLQKSANMKSFIGFPEWLTNATALNEHYNGLEANESTHLENMIGVLKWQMQMKLNSFNDEEPVGWATAPSNVNAFHTFQSNAISK